MKYSKRNSKKSAKKSLNKTMRLKTKKGGNKASSYISHKLPIDVSNLIDGFSDPVYALHLANSKWSVENTHGLNIEIKYGHQEKFNKVFGDSYREGRHIIVHPYKLCGDTEQHKMVYKEDRHGIKYHSDSDSDSDSDEVNDDIPDVPLADIEDEKYIKLGLREDKQFVSALGKFIDKDMKTYIMEHKLSNLDPKDAHIESVVISIRFTNILATTLFNLGGKFVEHVFEIHPSTKKISRYWGAEYVITTPPIKLNSEDLEILDLNEYVKKVNNTNSTVQKWEKHNKLNAELYAQAESIKDASKTRQVTKEERKILAKAENADKYQCSVHLDAHVEKLKEITLNRYVLMGITNDDYWRTFFSRNCENKDIERPYRYPEVGDYKEQPEIRALNRKVMKIINDVIKKHKGNKNDAIHELLRTGAKQMAYIHDMCNKVFTSQIFEEIELISDHDQVGELYGEVYPYVV
jgi:hypothetical protein